MNLPRFQKNCFISAVLCLGIMGGPVQAAVVGFEGLQQGKATEKTLLPALPDFTQLMRSEGSKVVHIVAQRPPGLSEEDVIALLKKMLPPPWGNGSGNPDDEELPKPSKGKSPMTGIGSGFFISNNGYILTNAHVVLKAEDILVKTVDRSEYKAKLVGIDPRTDIALLKIEAETKPVKVAEVDKMQVGEWVVAVGSPFGFENSMTAGVVSSTQRYLPEENYMPFIQSDVALNPGNSGGPLFNTKGQVVGINTQIVTRSGGYMGMSFSIPIQDALTIAEKLLHNEGKISRSRIGVRADMVQKEMAEVLNLKVSRGVILLQIDPEGPAAKAGLQLGDVVVAQNGKTIDALQEFTRQVAESKSDTPIQFTVLRGGKKLQVAVTPEDSDARDVREVLRKMASANEEVGVLGMVLSGQRLIKVGPQAKEAGLQIGDNVVQVQQTKIESMHDLEVWAHAHQDLDKVGVFFERGEKEAGFAIIKKP